MLKVSDLINIKYIPSISDISLQLLVDFYEHYLSQRIFVFELEDGQTIKLFFKDASEIFHVAGIDHIYEGMIMGGKHFIENVKNNSISLATLESVNKASYIDYKDRIRSFACIDTILKNCEYLWFSDGYIPKSTVKVQYLLLKGLDGKNLHLGIDTYKEGRPYFSKTLLVTEGQSATKFISRSNQRLRVVSIKIINKESNKVIEEVDRTGAVNEADRTIKELAIKWQNETLPGLIEKYIETFGTDKPNSRKKKEWISKLIKYLEDNKEYINDKVIKYDQYWASKIVAEQIREFKRKDAINFICKK